MAPYFERNLTMIVTGLLSGVPSLLFGIASYVLTALAIYTIARRRGLNKPWLAWVPVVNCWLLGSLSDQYQYVVKRETKSKRKWLLTLSILAAVLCVAIVVCVAVVAAEAVFGNDLEDVFGLLIGILGMVLPLAGISIAYCVIRYMALYDVYRSLDPANSVLFLVLSILFGVTEPFFLFFNRNKDQGMPPRRQETVYTQEPAQEPWQNENKDSL